LGVAKCLTLGEQQYLLGTPLLKAQND